MAKIRVQIPYTKFGVIEVSEMEYSTENMEKAKKLIEHYAKVEETTSTYSKKTYASSGGSVKPSEKQKGLITKLGGDVNKSFANWGELQEYIGKLKSKPSGGEPTPPPASTDVKNEVPWELDL